MKITQQNHTHFKRIQNIEIYRILHQNNKTTSLKDNDTIGKIDYASFVDLPNIKRKIVQSGKLYTKEEKSNQAKEIILNNNKFKKYPSWSK